MTVRAIDGQTKRPTSWWRAHVFCRTHGLLVSLGSLALLLGGVVYGWRAVGRYYSALNLAGFWLLFPLVGLLMIAMLAYALPARRILPLILLVLSLLVPLALPLPPRPDEVAFQSQRAAYEQVAEFARGQPLEPGEGVFQSFQALPLPPAAAPLDLAALWGKHASGLVLEFDSRVFQDSVYYLEQPEDLAALLRGDAEHYAVLERELGEGWYLLSLHRRIE